MNDEGKRKLATILAADVAGYSSHIEINEESALQQLRELRAILDRAIAAHGGRIANTAGDSVVAEFDSPVEAVRAAIEAQSAHKAHNNAVSVDQRLLFRIGINIGDIVVTERGDVLGNGVNVAARLQTLSEPGGICLSENVQEQIRSSIDFPITKIGEHFVKNMQRPVRVYSILSEDRSPLAALRARVIAVCRRPATQIAMIAAVAALSIVAVLISLYQSDDSGPDGLLTRLENASGFDDLILFFPDHVRGELGQSAYVIITTPALSYEEAAAVAAKFGGHLAAITSREENDYLYALSVSRGGFWRTEETAVWPQADGPVFGLYRSRIESDPKKGWVWSSGEPVAYTNWADSAPENAGGSQWFAQFRNGKGTSPKNEWDDIDSRRTSFIIEYPKD